MTLNRSKYLGDSKLIIHWRVNFFEARQMCLTMPLLIKSLLVKGVWFKTPMQLRHQNWRSPFVKPANSLFCEKPIFNQNYLDYVDYACTNGLVCLPKIAYSLCCLRESVAIHRKTYIFGDEPNFIRLLVSPYKLTPLLKFIFYHSQKVVHTR